MQEVFNIDDIAQLDTLVNRIMDEEVAAIKDIDWAPLFAEYTLDLQELHRNYFDSESDPHGSEWAPLAASTIKAKGHAERLIDTDEMLASLTADAENAIRELNVSPSEVHLVFGTSVEYAHYHITGTNKMPKREQVGVTEEVVEVWQNEIADNVLLAMRERR